jgi:hypothetical protein
VFLPEGITKNCPTSEVPRYELGDSEATAHKTIDDVLIFGQIVLHAILSFKAFLVLVHFAIASDSASNRK